MGLQDKLTKDGSLYSGLNGSTPSTPNLAGSKLHNTYSINGSPIMKGYPAPSILDLDGKTPEKYIDKIKK